MARTNNYIIETL